MEGDGIYRHPAKYADSLIPLFASMLAGTKNVLDPMAGTGKLARIYSLGYKGLVYLNEIEPEWLYEPDLPYEIYQRCTCSDAEELEYPTGFFDAVCTSPTYGNRMADHHNAQDGSRRTTYTHCLGRDLTPGNTGAMQWGRGYREKHQRIWEECWRVLRPGGLFILNVSDHIRQGERVPVVDWHLKCLQDLDFGLLHRMEVPTPRLRYGANRDARVDSEAVILLRRRD